MDDHTQQRLIEVLSRLVTDVQGVLHELQPDQPSGGAAAVEAPSCMPKMLPPELLVPAARTAVKVNPANAPMIGPVAAFAGLSDAVMGPERIAVLTSKYWGAKTRTLTVSFMTPVAADFRKRILSHMNAWSPIGVRFSYTTGHGKVRIAFADDGYWSYLGTDILHIPLDQQTMNLQGFSMATPESEWRRVVRHETGHTLGFPHEHMRQAIIARIDPEKAFAWFARYQGWDRATVKAQVLTPLSEASIMGTPPDETSIMAYQLPGSITTDGKPIIGGTDINPTDHGFASRIYPKASAHDIASDHDAAVSIAAAIEHITEPDLSEVA